MRPVGIGIPPVLTLGLFNVECDAESGTVADPKVSISHGKRTGLGKVVEQVRLRQASVAPMIVKVSNSIECCPPIGVGPSGRTRSGR